MREIEGHRRVRLVAQVRSDREAAYQLRVWRSDDGEETWCSSVAPRGTSAEWRAECYVSRLCGCPDGAEQRAAPSPLRVEVRAGAAGTVYASDAVEQGIFALLDGAPELELRRSGAAGGDDASVAAVVSCELLPLDVEAEREARRHFDVFVLDGAQRRISRCDVQRAMLSLGHHVDDDEAAAMVPEGGLGFSRFFELCDEATRGGARAAGGAYAEAERILLRAMFDAMDRGAKGALTLDDLRVHFNERLGEELEVDDIRELVRAARAAGGEEGGSAGVGAGVGAGEEQLDFAAFERFYAAMCCDGDGDDGGAEAA